MIRDIEVKIKLRSCILIPISLVKIQALQAYYVNKGLLK